MALEAFFTILFISDIVVGSKCVNSVVGATSKVAIGPLTLSVEVAKVAISLSACVRMKVTVMQMLMYKHFSATFCIRII